MSATQNKKLMQHVFAELSVGRSRAFRDAMADDVRWTIKGTGVWGGTWDGKEAVVAELLEPLLAQFADTYTNTAHRFIAEGDHVVVECRGSVATKRGARYDNSYCWVFRLDGGQVRELTEYMDTELAVAVLEAPARV